MSESMLKKRPLAPRRALTPTEIVKRLAELPGWKLSGDGADVAIEKSFTFADYHETIAFVNALAFVAHTLDHHRAHHGRDHQRNQRKQETEGETLLAVVVRSGHGNSRCGVSRKKIAIKKKR